MSTHKHIDKLCLVAAVFAIVLCALFMNGEKLGIEEVSTVMGYETRLFDTSRVHTIDIAMDDWDSFIEGCENEEYAVCSVTIDGEVYHNVGIRAKGNTSLSTVSSMDSDRYSFKIEFDQYDSTKSYHGLDKLSLNNLIQDTTMMKDYLTYQLMGQFGAAAPLCSYSYITVNGEDWGLYLAAEAIEDSFLQRSYGSDYGELYKPDSMEIGGGRGNGRDFNMNDFIGESREETAASSDAQTAGKPAFTERPENFDPTAVPSAVQGNGEMTSSFELPEKVDPTAKTEGKQSGGAGGMGGKGSEETKLQYINDDPDSYATIFSSAKTDVTPADQQRLIQSLKTLSQGGDIETVVDIDQVLRYFVVHNFVVNGDSYTGSMIHNYYLYEEDGILSMIPWDYNLAFGTFQGREAGSAVNDPIDTPLSVTGSGDRPMADWIFSSEEYTQLYHQYFADFLKQTDFASMINETAALIAPYVEKDPTKFCSTEDFEAGVAALREFCLLREKSVLGQLSGIIPATDAGQTENGSTLVDASHLTLSDMGTMNMGGSKGGDMVGERPDSQKGEMTATQTTPDENVPTAGTMQPPEMPENMTKPSADNTAPEPSMGSSANSQAGVLPEGAGETTLPGASGNRVPPGRGNGMTAPGGQMSGENLSTLPLLAISGAVLLLGLMAAKKYRRYG